MVKWTVSVMVEQKFSLLENSRQILKVLPMDLMDLSTVAMRVSLKESMVKYWVG